MYFASEETNCTCFRDFMAYDLNLDLGGGGMLQVRPNDNKMIKFIKQKLSKHLGIVDMLKLGVFMEKRLLLVIIRIYARSSD